MIFDSLPRPALIVPITGTTAQQLLTEAQEAQRAGADVIEWRMDTFVAAHEVLSVATLSTEVLAPLLALTQCPVILTMRTASQGGAVELSEGRYRLFFAELLDVIEHLAADKSRLALDIEFHFAHTPELARRAVDAGVSAIVSHHNWTETPDSDELYLTLAEMLELPQVVAKLAVQANTVEDVERMYAVTREIVAHTRREVITISMGDVGKSSRFEAWRHGSVATFVTVGGSTAPGQPTIEEYFEQCGGRAAHLARHAQDR